MLPVVDIFQVPDGEPHAGQWTFTVDGAPSQYYCPTQWAADRVVTRLKQGRTHSLGAMKYISIAAATQARALSFLQDISFDDALEVVKKKMQRLEVRGEGKSWHYILDGKLCETEFPNEAQAKAAGAFAEFMTRGKLRKEH